MILLQTSMVLRTTDPKMILAFGIAIVVLAIFLVVGALIARRSRPRSAADVERYSSATFRRAGKGLGLAGHQIDLLENLVRMCKVKQPLLVYTSASLLDDTLKKGLYSLDNPRDLAAEERENRRATIFQIKQIIERNARRGAVLRSTTFLKPGQLLSCSRKKARNSPARSSRT